MGLEPWDQPPPCADQEPDIQRGQGHRTLVTDPGHQTLTSMILNPFTVPALVLPQQINCQTLLGGGTAKFPDTTPHNCYKQRPCRGYSWTRRIWVSHGLVTSSWLYKGHQMLIYCDQGDRYPSLCFSFFIIKSLDTMTRGHFWVLVCGLKLLRVKQGKEEQQGPHFTLNLHFGGSRLKGRIPRMSLKTNNFH